MKYPETSYGYQGECWGPNSNLQSAKDNLLIGFFSAPETTYANQYIYEFHFRSLCFTFGIEMQLVYTPEEIIIPDTRPIISVEESRDNIQSISHTDFTHPTKAIYVVGNSKYQYPSDFLDVDYKTHISVPHAEHPMYGSQAMAVILTDKFAPKA